MRTNNVIQKKLLSEEEVSVELAQYVIYLSDKCIKAKDSFTVVLSGGTLIHTMRKLVEKPNADCVDWSKWFVFWLDERVVSLEDPDSNYKLAYDGFLSKVPIPDGNIFAIDDELSTEEAAEEYEARLRVLVDNRTIGLSSCTGFPKFDLVLLGMGPDGHVASLFPWLYQRYEEERWVTFVKDSPKPPSSRITMTFPVINSSSECALVVTGKQVAYAVKVALASRESNFIPLPVEMVYPEGNLTWFLDKDALSQLSNINDHSYNSLFLGLGFLVLIITCLLYYFPCIHIFLALLKQQ
ncbi:hypothetical protein DCAR_0414763 [Daucus carota subsp. sativus]|uniref:Probable 6-phosphogluconolactonase n=2 Tax=Daucus carota subsp. sativus TaxID=79200 RepID=A0AAF1AUH8_DAUCS|nr:PREDICTED: probable 6-phosphogluconolactonase 4, chloroplastic isoform X2 [Daucus carota subsp. sativus]WOG95444.1 hypothetical protein DCAR_0414763 [Daucus carota subsp. sativus]